MLTIRERLVVVVEAFYSAVIKLVLGNGQEHLLVLIAGCHFISEQTVVFICGVAGKQGNSPASWQVLTEATKMGGWPCPGTLTQAGVGMVNFAVVA